MKSLKYIIPILALLMAIPIAIFFWTIYRMQPTSLKTLDSITSCTLKIKNDIVIPHNSSVDAHMTRWHLSFEVKGDLDVEKTNDVLNEFGLFDTYDSIYFYGTTDSGVKYTLIFSKK